MIDPLKFIRHIGGETIEHPAREVINKCVQSMPNSFPGLRMEKQQELIFNCVAVNFGVTYKTTMKRIQKEVELFFASQNPTTGDEFLNHTTP